ncbi:MAG: hypothetical protein JNJ44_04205 [Zoogloeaceae bacterium]|nr:hypothetical protein [Zoogloeaceae bacterium]
MNRIAQTSLILIGLLAVAPAMAGPQQERMKQCNADAKTQSLTGDARASFMQQCLSGKTKPAAPADAAAPVASARTTQQEKMKTCNKEASAKTLKGDARNAFMSQCLKQ